EARSWRTLAGDLEHARALVEPDDLAAQVARQEAGAAGDVDDPGGRKRRHRPLELANLLVPARPVAGRMQASALVPVVVLLRAALVILAHVRCGHPSPFRSSLLSRFRIFPKAGTAAWSTSLRASCRRRRGSWTSMPTSITTARCSRSSATRTRSRHRWSPRSAARAT